MAPMRTAFLAASLLSAIRGDEEKDPPDGISLLQALSVKGVSRTDKKSVGALLETAGTLLKNGATADVIEFARATLEEISGVVIPAIRDASEADQLLLDTMYAQFEAALVELEEGNQRIHALNQERSTLSTQHKHCRDQEALFCVDKQDCDYHLWDLWKIFVEEERDLRMIEGSIDGHFCVQDEDGYYIANGTLFQFRAQSLPYMTSFIVQKVRVDTAEEHYDDYVPQCERKWTILDEQTNECDALQLSLERKACSHAVAIRDVQNTFAEAWNSALFSYNVTVHEVKLQEIDRISEYKTLSVVQCLLDRTSERNGRPCDESTDEISEEVTHCEQVRTTTDVTWLELTYHIVVANPHPCPDRHQVVGRCWPEVPPFPCQAQYLTEEYGSLPDVPVPVFSETNSHCNPRPDCESCTGIVDEPDVHLCTSQWSLTHYELCADNTVTPAPPPSNVQDPPAVCPAGWEQKGGAGADIGGCGLQSCGERYDLSSEAACAARCDEHSACVGFSYAPMNGDRNHPGVTACTIYNSDVPTGTWTGTEGIATQVFCGRQPSLECGDLPALTHSSWVSSLDGAHQYRCEEGFSFDGTIEAQPLIFEVECMPNGLYSDVHICSAIDDCNGHSCGAFGTCVDQHMDYTCNCMDGYEMTTTDDGEKICGNIDDCDGHLCGEAGVCVDLVSDYECHCEDGWRQVVMDSTGLKTCQRVECGDAPQIDNVVPTTSDIWSSTSSGIFPWTRGKASFGDIVEYTCSIGHTTNGLPDGPRSFTIVCQANGEYSEHQQCIPVSCGVPESAGAATPQSNAVTHFGDIVEYTCPDGHGPDVFQRACLETGQFTPAIACEPRLCPPLLNLVAADLNTEGGGYVFGQSVEYQCWPGYTTTEGGTPGAAFDVECGVDGWNYPILGCIPVLCEVVPDESHLRSETWVVPYGSENHAICADGYTIDGSATGAMTTPITCTESGVAELQPCRTVTCSGDHLETAPNADVVVEDHPLGSSATYTCHDGHSVAITFAETFEVQCMRNGFFSALSTCRNINDCEGHSCGSNGHCVDGINDYTCQCEDGFEEVINADGEKECGNIDDCGPNACGGNGVCHDLVNGYVCECAHGYVLHGEGVDQMCEPVICPAPNLDNIVEPVPETSFPETLFVECAEGHDLGGASGSKVMAYFMVECSADGVITSRGSTELPQCRPTVCGQPPDVGAEIVEVREYVYSETATSICQGGEVTITHVCGSDGQFHVTSEFSTCKNQCHEITGPEGASLTGGSLPCVHPESLEFTCPDGLTPDSTGNPGPPVSQTCQANGQFSPLPEGFSLCVPIRCNRPTAPDNWEWVFPEGVFNTVHEARLRCADGYQSDQAGADLTFPVSCNADASISVLPSPCTSATFVVTGAAKNAVNPTQKIPGTVLAFEDGYTVTASISGTYTLRLPAGTHHYTAHDPAGNYIPVERGQVTITGPGVYDVVMSPVLAENSWRVVLEWSESPRDLDSHLIFVGHSWSCGEVYYSNPRQSCNGVEVSLDWDEMWGHGPETVTLEGVNQCEEGWYTTCKWVYKVKNWTAFSWREAMGWLESSAVVRLFNGNHLIETFKVNDGHGHQATHGRYDSSFGEDDYLWSVFSLDNAGNVAACTNRDCD